MSTTTETLAFEMYQQLEAIRRARKHPIMLQNFEDDLEAYLEGLRAEHASLVESLQSNVALYQDAYENQKTLTRNALVYNREHYDELYQLRNQAEELKYNNELVHEKLQEATAKLASQTQTIIALLRVIKSQQNACARFKELVRITEGDRIREQAEAHRQIMKAEAMADDRWEQLEQKQELIVSQRKRIEELQDALLFSRKPARKPFFGWLFARQSTQAKPLPKKTI